MIKHQTKKKTRTNSCQNQAGWVSPMQFLPYPNPAISGPAPFLALYS